MKYSLLILTVVMVVVSIEATPSNRHKRQSNTAEFRTCFDRCKLSTTREYNPICGSDDITYMNRGEFGCGQRCNPALTLSFFGSCQPL